MSFSAESRTKILIRVREEVDKSQLNRFKKNNYSEPMKSEIFRQKKPQKRALNISAQIWGQNR